MQNRKALQDMEQGEAYLYWLLVNNFSTRIRGIVARLGMEEYPLPYNWTMNDWLEMLIPDLVQKECLDRTFFAALLGSVPDGLSRSGSGNLKGPQGEILSVEDEVKGVAALFDVQL